MSLWITEEDPQGIRTSFSTEKILYKQKSEFQDIEVVETKAYGKMLLLDSFVMITDSDEFVYHEMITHVPVCLHKAPKHVVVIGGGDGGTVRELLKHNEIEKITLCEIDALVIETSKKFFPAMAASMDNSRVDVRIGDGIKYIKELKSAADIIIIDSTDPMGPGEGLFSQSFYSNVARALRPNGLMAAQTESPWHQEKILKKISHNIKSNFPYCYPYIGAVPTYPKGLWSWTVAGRELFNPNDFNHERFKIVENSLSYLNEEVFKSCFALPTFFRKKL